jgi:hypothetical protein
MSRLSRQCGILSISQPFRTPRPVTGIAFYRQISLVTSEEEIARQISGGQLHGKIFGSLVEFEPIVPLLDRLISYNYSITLNILK